MEEKTIQFSIRKLLPGIYHEGDGCVDRLATELQERRGIVRAHLTSEQETACLCLHFDGEMLDEDDVHQVASRIASKIDHRYQHKNFGLEGMDCSECALVIEHSVGRLEGVLDVNVSFADESIYVEYDARRISQRSIERRVRNLGYGIEPRGLRKWWAEYRELVFSFLGGLLLLTGWFGGQFLGFPSQVSLGLYLGAYFFAGFDIARHSLHHLKERQFDTDMLMVLAALGAASLGEFAEGALLLFLFSLGHALEERALERARTAVRSLAELTPKTAIVRRLGDERILPVSALQIDDHVIVKPGVRVPVDGEIVAGYSAVDQSPVTGESVPVDKGPGEPVYAGSVNGEGVLDVRVTRLAKDSTLSRVMKMVEQAQAQKSPTQQMTERFSSVFVPAVLGVDFLLIVIPPLFGVPFAESFSRAMTLLVAASPCALALGAPAAILSGVAQAARNGVLVKGGIHLENLGRLNAIAFDKTGTLTRGEPRVTEVLSLNGISQDEILEMAAAVEDRSAHPLARAVVHEAEVRGLKLPQVSQVESLTGLGIRGRIDGRALTIGSRKIFEGTDVKFGREVDSHIIKLEEQGKTVLLVADRDQLLGLIAVADVIRAETLAALNALEKIGIQQTIMLSGDNRRAAAYIAQQAGLSAFQAELLPEQKLSAIDQLIRDHQVVGMVGDGVNDAPALANATVGIAMGGAATDVALESADVALMASDLTRLPFAIGLGRATRRIILQNLVIALSVIALLSVSALTGVVGIGLAVLVHEGSTLVVVLNALRLLRYRGPSLSV